MADIFDQLESGYQGGAAQTPVADPISSFESNYQAAQPQSLSLGDATSFVGKSLAEGAGKVLDTGGYLANHIMPGVFLPPSAPGESATPMQDLIHSVIGKPEDLGGGQAVVQTPMTNVIKAGVEGSVFPVGGPLVNTISSMGGEAAHQAFPDSPWAPLIGSLVAATGTDLVSKPLAAISDAFGAAKSEAEQIASLDINLAAIKKANKFKAPVDGETPIEQAVQGATERGVFSGDPHPSSIAERNAAVVDSLNAALHGTTNPSTGEIIPGILQAADEAQTESISLPLTKATNFIKGHPQENALANQLEARKTWIENNWDGSISGLSSLKSQLGKISYVGSTESKVLDQAIYQDLKTTVEKEAEKAVPGLGQQVKALNSDLSEHYTLEPIIERAANKAIQQGFKLPPTGILKGALTGGLKGTAIGGGATLLGQPHLAVPGMALGALYGGTKAALNKPLVSNLISAVTGKAANALTAPSLVGSAVVGALATDSAKPSQPASTLSTLLNKTTGVAPSPTPASAATKLISEMPKAKTMDTPTVKPTETEVPKALVKAVIKQESGGNSKAVSNKNAEGLMQIMPATAKDIATQLGVTKYDLKDPETNIKFGTHYLAGLLKEFNNDPELALTAYHSGPNRVKALLRLTGGTKLSDIIDYLGPVGKKYAKEVLARMPSNVMEA